MWLDRFCQNALAAAGALAASCALPAALHGQHIHEWQEGAHAEGESHLLGKVVGDRYFAYNEWFSIAVPKAAWDGYVTDHYPHPGLGSVMFFNDVGYLLKVEVDQLPPEVCSIIGCHPAIKDEVLDAIFYDAMLPQMKESVPGLQVLHERKLSLENDEQALFAVVDMPESATMIDRRTGRCMDSKRGYLLIFSQDRRLVAFSIQDTYSLLPGCAESASSYLKERLLSHLIKVHGDFRHGK